MTHPPVPPSRKVLWHIIIFCAIFASAPAARAQKPDTVKADSIHRFTFGTGSTNIDVRKPQRTIDLALTGGEGYYFQGDAPSMLTLANADFFAQTSDLDLTAGFHWGFPINRQNR
jgi:hypothetical protein